MAPGANQLVVGGDSCNDGDFGLQGLFDADIAIDGTGNHPLATIASNSWGAGDETQPAVLTNIEHAYLVRAAAEGVGMYFSSGDAPASRRRPDPFAIPVGGTTLGIGKTTRLFETGWSTGVPPGGQASGSFGEDGAAGGGPSLIWASPGTSTAWCRPLAKAPGNRAGLVRSAPDISPDADPFTGFATGMLNSTERKPPKFGHHLRRDQPGLADGGRHHRRGPAGPARGVRLHRPGVLPAGRNDAFHDTLPSRPRPRVPRGGLRLSVRLPLITFDDQNPTMNGYTGQVTLKGYDNMTGIGTPAGQSFITCLRSVR